MTRPSAQVDGALRGMQAPIGPEWGGGAYTEVLDDGESRGGDPAAPEE